ncbi:hypothetical protein BDZ94DRAFT_1312781 [Collybia nuda]|uniref:Uncharacterized protein n=1 Tax=Collybia nuda TaxID=64659 RepID=A0A9P5Y0A1_9AGAR|nr:hypothetical protein BDZ94DRAFT_1312781 [Collybia nuda]
MLFFTIFVTTLSVMAAFVAGSPVAEPGTDILVKCETSYGDPDLVTDQGNRFKLNFGNTDDHPNACPGHFICCASLFEKNHRSSSNLNGIFQISTRMGMLTATSHLATPTIWSTKATVG